MWGHDHESIQTEQDCTLAEDCNSFEMHRMMVQTDQLLCITAATNSQIYTRDLETKAHGWTKTLALSLKQYHTHYYHCYEKGMTRAMVGLQRLHLNDASRCSNVSSSVGLKSFCPRCFMLGGNTEMIATNLREVHYQLAITCDLCKLFTSMSAQSVLEHHSGCKAKCMKEHAEQEGHKAKKSHKKNPKVQEQEKAS